MLKLLIADDEPVIINGLKQIVEWESLGFEICCTCEDGNDALREIMTQHPDLALLDISMPGKTGIDILKALQAAASRTKVIFISGFQDFTYARDALSYGAVDYLLKPVKREELLRAVEKCMKIRFPEQHSAQSEDNGYSDPFGKALNFEPSSYLLAAVAPLTPSDKNDMEQQLIEFSVYGQLDMLCRQSNQGVAFQKKGHSFLLLVNVEEAQARQLLHEMQQQVFQRTGCRVGFVFSPSTPLMRDVPGFAEPCLEACRYFYFDGWLPDTILPMNGSPFAPQTESSENLRKLQQEIAENFLDSDQTFCQQKIGEYISLVARISDGQSDVAMYHLLVCGRILREKLESTGVSCPMNTDQLLSAAREAANYQQLTKILLDLFEEMRGHLIGQVKRNERRDIQRVIEYMEEHYQENLTLEVLARHIHMNSYYFSSYFKKQVGQNFKDYLNRIRMRHAMELLLNTDQRSYEIAMNVGFRDHRYFNELFSRYYGKTPAVYRKEYLAQNTNDKQSSI